MSRGAMCPLTSLAKTGVGKFASDDCAHSCAAAVSVSRNVATVRINLRDCGPELSSMITSPAGVPSLPAAARKQQIYFQGRHKKTRPGRALWPGLLWLDAEGGTRTPTSCLTRPSNVRVYQFRHFRSESDKQTNK